MSDGRDTPGTIGEFMDRFKKNQYLSGMGLDCMLHMPCPFCAAPEWIVYHIWDVKAVLTQGAQCQECGRGAKTVFHADQFGNVMHFELFQTVGDDPPAYVGKNIRRAQQQ